MTMTQEEHKQKTARSYKLILIFAMVSMIMMFAGLTSAFVVSKARVDWLKDFQLPTAFYYSTLALGILFVVLQFVGFGQIVENGYYFTGSESSITTTFLYIVTVVHLIHLAGGLISLLIIIYNHFKQKYNSSQTLGIELGAMYWHFLDFLWIYLFVFLYFFK
ncbi:cytochrome c oxidase subunit 3, partial [Flavobacterium sp.]|uniref:cytochrome c oxidase subunit 3 n=1 Tax=Flavobacterium sp. TaxID=239 RepID=UPI00261CFF25